MLSISVPRTHQRLHALQRRQAAACRQPRSVRRPRHPQVTVLASSSGECVGTQKGQSAWRGFQPTQSSLPLLEDGTPDYSSIDALPQSKVLMSAIRKLLIEEVGYDSDPRPYTSFEGMLTSIREVNDMVGTAEDVQQRAERVFKGILPAVYIGWIPPIWKKYVQPNVDPRLANASFVLVFVTLFPWLMGPIEGIDEVDYELPETLTKLLPFLPKSVKLPQAIKAERCRFIEGTQCASVCVNSCKVPSQNWLFADFGMPIHIQPNYDDFSCSWKFNVVPPPLEEDEAVMVPCFTDCPSEYRGEKDAFRQRQRVKMGYGIVDGVDTFTGETLEDIAARASKEAIAEAALTPDGSALSMESLQERKAAVTSGGKCWSVSEERLTARSE